MASKTVEQVVVVVIVVGVAIFMAVTGGYAIATNCLTDCSSLWLGNSLYWQRIVIVLSGKEFFKEISFLLSIARLASCCWCLQLSYKFNFFFTAVFYATNYCYCYLVRHCFRGAFKHFLIYDRRRCTQQQKRLPPTKCRHDHCPSYAAVMICVVRCHRYRDEAQATDYYRQVRASWPFQRKAKCSM